MNSEVQKPIIFFLFLSSCLQICDCENSQPASPPTPYALSTPYLIKLAVAEVNVYRLMAKYSNKLQERLKLIKEYMKDYEESSTKATAHLPNDATELEMATAIVSHPIAAYRMVRRLSTEFNAIGAHVNKNFELRLKDRLNGLSTDNPWPSKNELVDSMDSILRIHYTYDLNLEEFTDGNIMGIQTNVGFTSSQVFEIAEYAAEVKYYSLALKWLKLAESKMMEESHFKLSPVSSTSVEKTRKQIIEMHDRNFDSNVTDSYTHFFMFTEQLSQNPNAETVRSRKYRELQGLSQSRHSDADYYNFLALCNRKNFQTPSYKATLNCWYDKRNPYFYLFPLKAELLNHDPLLIQFHDVVGDKWIKEMKEAALPTLKRAPYILGATPRSGVHAWLQDEDIPGAPIGRRVELITGLHVRGRNASMELQITSYAFGCHVSPHCDALVVHTDAPPYFKRVGDRVTTFLIYLNDAPKGGLTVYPALGTYAEPIKGSAVLWYATLKNGDVDKRMVHGACPIIMGQKWVGTKWTYLKENFLTRPCDLNPEA